MLPIKTMKPVRTYNGELWKTNGSNKKRLAIDFNKKCAYCDDSHIYCGGYNTYHVEHFAPKEKFPQLEFVYDNLLYSCPYCNISKSDKWIGNTHTENVIGDQGFVDPCSDEYYTHLQRDEKGNIVYLTNLGMYMHRELKLYLKRHSILYNLEKVRNQKSQLKAKIEENNKTNKDTKTLVEFYSSLCCIFCEYYDLLVLEE